MPTSRIRWSALALALAVFLPLGCRQAVSEESSPATEKDGELSAELDAGRISGIDKSAPPERVADGASAKETPLSKREVEFRAEMERRRRETRRQAGWELTVRTDTSEIVPCQPLFVTVEMVNATDQPRTIEDLFSKLEIWILVGRAGEQPRVALDHGDGDDTNYLAFRSNSVVRSRARVFYDQMLTTLRADGSTFINNPSPERIFGVPGEYQIYAALVDRLSTPGWFEVVRSEPLVVTVREPTESETPFVAFFREGRQIPPHYGFSKVDEEAFAKVRGQGMRTAAFQRQVDSQTIDKLRAMLAKHPDPPVADDVRQYLMRVLIRSARKYDDVGRDQGLDREVLAAAAQQYVDIDPKRKQLRRRGMKTWRDLSTHFELDHAQPMLQILASWKTDSPFYEDEVESQAELDKIIDKIETRYAQLAAKRAAAPPPKRKLPTD